MWKIWHGEAACLRWVKSSERSVLRDCRSGKQFQCSQVPQMPPSRHSCAHPPLNGWADLLVCAASRLCCLPTRSAGDDCHSASQERQIWKAPAEQKPSTGSAWSKRLIVKAKLTWFCLALCGEGFTSWLGVPPLCGARLFCAMKASKSGCLGMAAWGSGLSQKGCCGSSSHPIRVAGFLSSRRVMRSSKAALTSGREPAWFRSESLESCLHSSECTWYNFKQYCNFVEDKQAC